MTVLIKGGTVISTTGADPAEVLVDGETIIFALDDTRDEFVVRVLVGVENNCNAPALVSTH